MPWGARLSLASHLKFSGDGIPWPVVFGADTDPKVFLELGIPSVALPLEGGTPWVLGMGMGFPWHPTSAQSKTAGGIYSFSSWFLFYNLNFGCVFDSFYLLSHHPSSCTGAAPDVLNP